MKNRREPNTVPGGDRRQSRQSLRDTKRTSERTTLCSKRALPVSHTVPSFFLFPTKFRFIPFCGGPCEGLRCAAVGLWTRLRAQSGAKREFFMHYVHPKSPFCCSGVCLPGCGAVQIFDLGNSAHARDAREQERIARTVNGCGLLAR